MIYIITGNKYANNGQMLLLWSFTLSASS